MSYPTAYIVELGIPVWFHLVRYSNPKTNHSLHLLVFIPSQGPFDLLIIDSNLYMIFVFIPSCAPAVLRALGRAKAQPHDHKSAGKEREMRGRSNGGVWAQRYQLCYAIASPLILMHVYMDIILFVASKINQIN